MFEIVHSETIDYILFTRLVWLPSAVLCSGSRRVWSQRKKCFIWEKDTVVSACLLRRQSAANWYKAQFKSLGKDELLREEPSKERILVGKAGSFLGAAVLAGYALSARVQLVCWRWMTEACLLSGLTWAESVHLHVWKSVSVSVSLSRAACVLWNLSRGT